MTLKQARTIVKMHDYHIAQRTKARQEGDTETFEIHQACLNNMRAEYNEASDLLIKRQG